MSQHSGPATLSQSRNSLAAHIPFVLPQKLFQGGTTQQHMGQGIAVQVAFTSTATDYTVVHNLGHPINMVWAVMAPAGVFIPKVKISTTPNANPSQSVILVSDTIANPTTVVMF